MDVVTILPMLLTCGLLTRSDSEYFISSAHTTVEKQQRLTCLAISLNEECVEKFLKCLSQTAVEYAPHSSLLEKIQKGNYIFSLVYPYYYGNQIYVTI